MTDLCGAELELMRSMAGEIPGLRWGAAVGACLEFLRGSGLVEQRAGVWVLSPQGLAELEERRALDVPDGA